MKQLLIKGLVVQIAHMGYTEKRGVGFIVDREVCGKMQPEPEESSNLIDTLVADPRDY